MSNHSQQIVQKLWNYCNVLRDDGLSYGDYVEQLTYLLFLKMADEQTQPPFNSAADRPGGLRLAEPAGAATATSWRSTTGTSLETLGKRAGHARRHLPQGAEQDPGPGQARAGSSST